MSQLSNAVIVLTLAFNGTMFCTRKNMTLFPVMIALSAGTLWNYGLTEKKFITRRDILATSAISGGSQRGGEIAMLKQNMKKVFTFATSVDTRPPIQTILNCT